MELSAPQPETNHVEIKAPSGHKNSGSGNAAERSLLSALGKLDLIHHAKTFDVGEPGKTMHAYALLNTPLYVNPDDQGKEEVQIIVPIGPIHVNLIGTIDFPTATVNLLVYVIVPLLPPVLVGHFDGKGDKDIPYSTVSFDIPHVGSTQPALRLFRKRDGGRVEDALSKHQHDFEWLCLEAALKIYQESYKANVRLLPFPEQEPVRKKVEVDVGSQRVFPTLSVPRALQKP